MTLGGDTCSTKVGVGARDRVRPSAAEGVLLVGTSCSPGSMSSSWYTVVVVVVTNLDGSE
jgi:hypothetical protein